MAKGTRQKRDAGKKSTVRDTPSPSSENIFSSTVYWGVAIIFVIGLMLRLFALSRKSLWLDEASTNFLTTQPDLISVINAAFNDHHAPLHFVTIWFVKTIGSTEFLLRLPSAIAGSLTVIVIFFIARELYGDEAGLIAALLLALSPYHILYSQEARMYGMAVLFVALAVWFFLRSIRTGARREWICFGAACTLAFYTHFYTAFIIISLILSYGIIRFREFRVSRTKEGGNAIPVSLPHDFWEFCCGLAVAFILVLPLLSSFFNQSGYFISRTFNWGITMWNIPSQTFLMFSLYSDIIAILFFCLMITGLGILLTRNRELTAALVCILFIPILISMYLSQIIPFNVRYHLYLIVIFLSLVAIPLSWAANKIHARYGIWAIFVILLLISSAPLASYYTEPLQEDWRSFASNLKYATQPGDIIAPLPWYDYLPLSYYYDNTTDGTFYRNFALDNSGYASLDNATTPVYFVVTWDISAADPSGYSVQYLNDHTTQVQGSVPGIYLLRKSS